MIYKVRSSGKYFYVSLMLVLLLPVSYSFSQHSKTDSLLNYLKNYKSPCQQPCLLDSSKVNALNLLAWELSAKNTDTALILGNEALLLSQKMEMPDKSVGWLIGIGSANHNLGTFYKNKANYVIAMGHFWKALNIWDQISEEDAKKGIVRDRRNLRKRSATYGNIAVVFLSQGDYSKALDFFLKSLEIAEELDDKDAIARQLGNIGIVYAEKEEYPKALEYFKRALAMNISNGSKVNQANWIGNIGLVYKKQGDLLLKKGDSAGASQSYPQALEHYFKALKLGEGFGDKKRIELQLGNIGSYYYKMKEYDKALEYFEKERNLDEEIKDKRALALTLSNIGAIYTAQKKYPEAEKYLLHSVSLCDSIGIVDYKRDAENNISDLYSEMSVSPYISPLMKGQYAIKALEHFKIATTIKDSLLTLEKSKEIERKELSYEFAKKEAAVKAEQEKKDMIAAEESKKQKVIIFSVIAGLLLVLVFTGFILKSLKTVKKQHRLIELKNKETEEQKAIIEEKSIEITDSIHYAKRIQQVLMASTTLLKNNLPEYFILYKPKAIVSGDFYWADSADGKFIMITADCTGHGVPGAFMSLLNISFLNQAVNEKKIQSPELILDHVREQIINSLNPLGSDVESKDGMDATICMFDFKGMWLRFSCANNPLWLIRNNELKVFAADKMPVGMYHGEQKGFSKQTLGLRKGDIIYMFTDGYADQFGGPQGKKFKYKQLKEKLLAIKDLSMEEQKTMLDRTFEEWKGNTEQVDDVCIIGIRV
jgi:tetratricopeptide (TPR) repeat protein